MFRAVISSLLYQSPFLMIEAVGLVLAMIWWKKHPRLSLLIAVGLGTALLHTFLFTILLPMVASFTSLWYLTAGGSKVMRILSTLMNAFAYLVVVLAAFYGFVEGKKQAAK